MKKGFSLLLFILFFANFSYAQAQGICKWKVVLGNWTSAHGIQTNGTLWGWGGNVDCVVGIPNSVPVQFPTQIGTDNDWASISDNGGGAMHAIKTNKTLWAWGSNHTRSFGDSIYSTSTYCAPVQIGSDADWKSCVGASSISLALKMDGSLWVAGFNNDFGALGLGLGFGLPGQVQRPQFTRIGNSTWKFIASNGATSYAIRSDGTLWAWGNNDFGQLGNGNTNDMDSPKQIGTSNNWASVSCEYYHVVALKTDGTLWAWGYNSQGQLGDGTRNDQLYPKKIGTANNWIKVVSGNHCSFGLKSDGSLWAWGDCSALLGDGICQGDYLVPKQIGIDKNWIGVSCSISATFAWKSDKVDYCAVGYNSNYELGDGTVGYKDVFCSSCVPPAAPASSNKTICTGNSVTLSATGVTNGTLSWYTAATNGNYLGSGANYTTPILNATTTYYVQDSTCGKSLTRTPVVVTVNSIPNVTAHASVPYICVGNSVTLTGNGASSYSWSGGVINGVAFSPTTTTTYTVTGSNGTNCSKTATITVSVGSLQGVTANASSTSICAGALVTLTGGGATNYLWSGGVANGVPFVPTATQTYTVTGSNATGCSGTSTVTIVVKPMPDVAAAGDGNLLNASQSGATYQWMNCDNNSIIPGATSQSYTAPVNGNYAVIVTLNGCSDTSGCVPVSSVTGVNSFEYSQLKIYPNPSTGIIYIEGKEIGDYSIVNELGQTIQRFVLNNSNNNSILIENLESGIYFIIGINHDKMLRQKVVVLK